MTPCLLQPAYVLHRRPYRDSSLWLDFWSQDFGRLHAIAKGAYRPRSPFSLILQPLRPLLISCVGRHELLTLTHAEEVIPLLGKGLTGNLLYSGLYVNELLYHLTRSGDSNPELFQQYHQLIQALGKTNTPAVLLRGFEKNLLKALGYGLRLNQDGDNQPINPKLQYNYWLEHGPLPLGKTPEDQGLFTLSGASLLALHHQQFDSHTMVESTELTRRLLAHYLGNRTLHTRTMMQWQKR